MILSYTTRISAQVHGPACEDHAGDLTDRLRTLERENRDLQLLVCYLLQKNEALRMRIWNHCQ